MLRGDASIEKAGIKRAHTKWFAVGSQSGLKAYSWKGPKGIPAKGMGKKTLKFCDTPTPRPVLGLILVVETLQIYQKISTGQRVLPPEEH